MLTADQCYTLQFNFASNKEGNEFRLSLGSYAIYYLVQVL